MPENHEEQRSSVSSSIIGAAKTGRAIANLAKGAAAGGAAGAAAAASGQVLMYGKEALQTRLI